MMRDRKAQQAESNITGIKKDATAVSESSEESDEETLNQEGMTLQEIETLRRVKIMAKSLNVTIEQAKIIDKMTASKGITSKTLMGKQEDDAMAVTPGIVAHSSRSTIGRVIAERSDEDLTSEYSPRSPSKKS